MWRAPKRFRRLPSVPLRIESVESPASTGPVTAKPAAVIVSWPSFSANVIRAINLSILLTGNIMTHPQRTSSAPQRRGTRVRSGALLAEVETVPVGRVRRKAQSRTSGRIENGRRAGELGEDTGRGHRPG